jgi:Mg2+ and Co2+ transporter CorA
VDIRVIADGTVTDHEPAELAALLHAGKGIVWVDIPSGDARARQVLAEDFEFHPAAVRACAERNRIAKAHVYVDHRLDVLHAPHAGAAGHVHYVELDQLVGPGYVVTVHGPCNQAVDPAVMNRETGAVLERLRKGRLRPDTANDLAHAIVSALVRTMEEFVERLTEEVWRLEQQMTSGERLDPESFLEDLFRVRHGLLAVRTMAGTSREIYARADHVGERPAEVARYLADLADQFGRVRGLANAQWEYLQGVIDYFRARTETKMTIATERLAVIAAVTLPVTALASVYGMNVIVNTQTKGPQLIAVLVLMIVASGLILRWARRQGWW